MSLYDDLMASNPWLKQFNLTPQRIQSLLAASHGAADLLDKIRAEPSVKQRFAGMYRQDGSLRMNEAEYLQTENNYRNLLRQAGVNVDSNYSTPASLLGFFQGEIAPDELRDRLQVWNQVKGAGKSVKEAFYAYAGLSVSDDDLYEAAVDPSREIELYKQYQAAAAADQSSPGGYARFITRTTELALGRLPSGSPTPDANHARQVLDAIFHNGKPNADQDTLNLNQLLEAFQFAAIGGAATEAGLTMPTKARLEQIRAAGIDADKAIAGYTAFGLNKAELSAAVMRARGRDFTQTDFESAQFFGNVDQSKALAAGQAYMEAAGREAGSFRFAQRGDQIVQSGFTNY
jgi:hypothetical protein